jgi:acetyl esterase/lipase
MDIWIPRNLTANSHPPVLVNWHGGGLISGVRDNGEWWQQYILDLAVQHNALMLAPDYPLAPEAQTPDILASIERFLAWLLDDGGLQTALDQHAVSAPLRITADTTKLLVMGSSSGGWCALWTGIKRSQAIRTLLLQCPMIDLADDFFSTSQVETPATGLFAMLKALPESIVDEYLAKLQPGAVRVSEPRTGPGFPLTGAAFVHGRVLELLGQDSEETYPFRALQREGVRLPGRIWVVHGRDDYVVPVRGSERLVELVEKNATGTEIRLDTATGDHGFDVDLDRSAAAVPVDERLRWVEEVWLA